MFAAYERERMSESMGDVRFEKVTEIEAVSPTLIEGLPGFGLVAAIAVNQSRNN